MPQPEGRIVIELADGDIQISYSGAVASGIPFVEIIEFAVTKLRPFIHIQEEIL